MIPGKSLENFGGLFPLGLFNNNISLQDARFLFAKYYLASSIITNAQKNFIIQNNKEFYTKYKNIYAQNIDLKNKLSVLSNEKKRLKNIIINLDKKVKNKNLSNSKENEKISSQKMTKIEPYSKRIRRKKIEINDKYFCTFPGCNKGYFSKCSLNMHIKLKHK